MENIARLLLFALSELRPSERLSAGASRLTGAAGLSAAAAVLMIAAVACLIAAGWIAMIPIVGQAAAALCAAVGLALIATICWLLARTRFTREPERDPVDLAGLHQSLHGLLGENTLDDIKRIWGENKLPILLAVLIAGMTMGGSHRSHND